MSATPAVGSLKPLGVVQYAPKGEQDKAFDHDIKLLTAANATPTYGAASGSCLP